MDTSVEAEALRDTETIGATLVTQKDLPLNFCLMTTIFSP